MQTIKQIDRQIIRQININSSRIKSSLCFIDDKNVKYETTITLSSIVYIESQQNENRHVVKDCVYMADGD